MLWEESLKDFFASEIAAKAGSHLSESATISLHIEDRHFLFCRTNGQNTLSEEQKNDADVHFWVPVSTLRHLLAVAALPGTGMGTLGVTVFEHLFGVEEGKKIRFKVNMGFLGLWAKGYFSVLKAGGPEVASYLKRWGFDSVSRIKDVLRKIRS